MMSNVVEIRPGSAGDSGGQRVRRDYFAVVDEFGKECPVLADSIERALSAAEGLECLGGARQAHAKRHTLKLVN
jgi:hypothetical protein